MTRLTNQPSSMRPHQHWHRHLLRYRQLHPLHRQRLLLLHRPLLRQRLHPRRRQLQKQQ
jgi:hypothetical protein